MPFSPKALTVDFSVFVSVLCVLCAFVVKNPSPVALLNRSRPHPAHYTPALCSNVIHPSNHVGHQNRPLSPLPAPSISVRPLQTCVHAIFNVIKCNHFYRQLPPFARCHPTRNLSTVELRLCALAPLRLCVFALCRSSFVLRPFSLRTCETHHCH
jgi:hypothetical protein